MIASIVLGLGRVHAQGQIDPRFGHLVLNVHDVALHTGAVTIEFTRALEDMRADQRGLLGNRWRSNWESRALATATGFVIDEAPYPVAFARAGGASEYRSLSGEQLVVHADGRFVRTTLTGSRETFDRQGRLVERDYRNGNNAIVRYGADGRISRIDGPRGMFIQLFADDQGRVVRLETSTGRSARYAYVGDNLVEVQVNGGPAVRYTYNTRRALSRIDHPRFGAVDFTYDAHQRVVSRRWADGAEERFEYNDAARERRRIDPAGAVTVTRLAEDGRRAEVTDPRGGKTIIAFDASGRAESVTGPAGDTTKVVYDTLGRTAAVHDSNGQVTRYGYLGATGLVTSIARPDGTQENLAYDPQQNAVEVKLGPLTLAMLAYNGDGTISTAKALGIAEQRFTYDERGRLHALTDALGGRLQYSYDARGNPLRAVNPLGGVTAFQWNAQNQLVSETDPVGGITRYEYDTSGRLARVIDALGGVSRLEYDVRGRLVAETDPSGQITRYEYDRAGRLAKLSTGAASETFRYDASGNLNEWVDRLGRTVQIERDLVGRATQERASTGAQVRYRYDTRGRLDAMEDPRAGKLELQRDQRGLVIAQRDALGAITQFQYDEVGNVIGRRDPRGHLKQFGYTGEGMLARVQEPSGDAAEYRYDAAHRLVETVRPSGGRSRFTYNALGQLIQEINPLGNERRREYDLAGRLTSTTHATGRTTRYTYDAAGRRIEKRLADGKRVTFKYDSLGNLLAADDGAFPVRYQYDREGRPVKVEYPAIKKALGYEYNAEGLRTKLIDTEGRTTRYEYNAHKQLAAIIPPDGKPIALAYDAQDRLQSIRYPNGLTGTWEYDIAGRLAKLAYADGNGRPISAWTYHYDPNGNLLRQQDTEGRGTTYSYDAAGQLTETAGSAGVVRYRYGRGGSRIAMEAGTSVTNYRHDSGDRLLEAGPEKLSYDANGNLIRRERPGATTTYEYDAEDRLVKVEGSDGKTTTFGYAPTGERVWKRDAGGLTYFVYDGLDLIQELDDKGNVKASYVHGPGIDQSLAMLREGKSFYYHADRLGSVRALTDERGGVAATYDYDAFGKLETIRGAVSNPFTYTGREWDASTGLYYYRARYYDPTLGRFLSPDPLPAALDEPLEQNPYLYVRNNPLRFVDPLGLTGTPPADLYDLPRFGDPPKPTISNQGLGMREEAAILKGLKPTGGPSPVRVLSGLDIPEGMTVRQWNEQIKDAARTWGGQGVKPPPGMPVTPFEGSPEEVTIRFGRPKAPTAPSAQVPRPVVPPATAAAVVEAEAGVLARAKGLMPSQGTIAILVIPVVAKAIHESAAAEPGQRLKAAGESLSADGGAIVESAPKVAGCAAIGAAIGFCTPVPGGAAIGAKIGATIPLVVDLAKAAGKALEPYADKLKQLYPEPPPPGQAVPPTPGLSGPVSDSLPGGPAPPQQSPAVPPSGTAANPFAGSKPHGLKPATPAQIAGAAGLAGPTEGVVPPIVPPGVAKKKVVEKQPEAYTGPPVAEGTQPPPLQPPTGPECPQTDPAGHLLGWVRCPPGVAAGTPLAQGHVWCRSASGDYLQVRMYPCPPTHPQQSKPPTAGAPPRFGDPTASARPQPSVPPPSSPPGTQTPAGTAGGGTPPPGPVKSPLGIAQAPVAPVAPGTTTPKAPTGAPCSAPLCRQLSQANCERINPGVNCAGIAASLPSCPGFPTGIGPVTKAQQDQLAPDKVRAACYANMLQRCRETEAGGTGSWCVGKSKGETCEQRAQRSC